MSGTQRLEIIILAMLLVLGMAVGAVVMLVRPSTPTYVQSAPQPLGQTAATALAVPTSAPIAPVAPKPASAIVAEPVVALPFVDVQRLLLPIGLVVMGLACSVLLVGVYRRRGKQHGMPHVNQSVAMLFKHASREARDSNLRVMNELAEKGLLPADLQATVRKQRSFPVIRFPTVQFPTVQLPTVRLPRISLPTLRLPDITPPTLPTQRRGGKDKLQLDLAPAAIFADALIQAQDILPQAEEVDGTAVAWTAEDRALLIAAALENVWTQLHLSSEVLALDAAPGRGHSVVSVWIDPAPGEEATLLALPAHILAANPSWQARWRDDALDIRMSTTDLLPTTGPLLIPTIEHRQRGERLRFLQLRTWQHLAIVGPDAQAAVHGLLVNLLYTHGPATLALALTDSFPTERLFTNVAHRVELPNQAIVPLISDALRRSRDQWNNLRRIILVVADPEPEALPDLVQLVQRLRGQTDIPLSLFLTLTVVRPCDREVLALLPALIAGAGSEPQAAWLPGGQWAKAGAARFVGRTMRLEGKTRLVDEGTLADMLGPLSTTQPLLHLPLVLWQAQERNPVEVPVTHVLSSFNAPTPFLSGDEVYSSVEEDVTPFPIDVPETHIEPAPAILIEEAHIELIPAILVESITNQPEQNDTNTAPHRSSVVQPDETLLDTLFAPDPEPERVYSNEQNSGATPVEQAPTISDTDPHEPTEAQPIAYRSTSLLQSVVFGGHRRERPTYGTPATSGNTSSSVPRTLSADTASPSSAVAELPTATPSKWPEGPFGMLPNTVASLIEILLTDPTFKPEREHQAGVSKSRLMKGAARQCLPQANADQAARFFLVWCETAGLLHPSSIPERPFRDIRQFMITDLDVIAEKLHAAALPSKSAVDAAYGDA